LLFPLFFGAFLLNANYVNAQDTALEPHTPNSAMDQSIDRNSEEGTVNTNHDALFPTASPLDTLDGTANGDFSFDQVSVYVVKEGDKISQIADMFGVSESTILAANDMKKGDKLVVGDTLFILPISGLEHTVTKGQTLKGIATFYKVDVSDIALYNGITEDSSLAVGDKLIIPGAEMLDEGGDKPSPNLGASTAKDKNYYASHPIKGLAGYFINPVPTGIKTQGLHDHNEAIDIGAPTGTPIYASASGVVLAARGGFNGGYGNTIIIDLPNGVQTLYGHMSKIATSTGAHVSQGEIIGYVGSTGRSTGPHLHFKVVGAKNPGADWSWKK